MPLDRVTQIVAELDLRGRPLEGLHRLCVASASALGVDGAGIALIVGGEHRGSVSSSDDRSAAAEELQAACGEGPCFDAHRSGAPVLEPDLGSSGRWGAFTPAALEVGVGAAFAFPLDITSGRFGALDLYRSSAGPLVDEDVRDARAIATLATNLVVMAQAGAPPGSLPEAVGQMMDSRAVVHQAAGMVSVQLGVAIEDATVALRARAYATGRSLEDLATDVVGRRLRFDP